MSPARRIIVGLAVVASWTAVCTLVPNGWWKWLIVPAGGVIGYFTGGFIVTGHLPRRKRGRNRNPETSDRDTGAAGVTVTFSSGGTGTITTTSSGEGASEDDIETIQQDIPILAHRAARLLFNGDRYPFGAVNRKHGTFGVDAVAVCHRRDLFDWSFATGRTSAHVHAAPHLSCDCGFYALPPDLEPTYEDVGLVTLLVELSGQVIEHEKGYRAGHQRVVECQLPPCPYCSRKVDVVEVRDGAMTQATCIRHRPDSLADETSERGRVYVTVDDIAAVIPVLVSRLGRGESAP